MDFVDELRDFSSRASQLKDVIATEEATKNALVLPFFQLLGYDVFNPIEFIPEFCADVGIKKGEKVDYAITIDNAPAILVEAKWCGATLDKHDSQLFRYFGTTTAKFGILTNGIVYKFYTDLDEPNKMDLVPFMEFDVLNIKEGLVPELKRFCKSTIDIESAINAASELKYTNLIRTLIHKQRTAPDEDFINYVLGNVYTGRRTQVVVERFTDIIKKALNMYISDVINDTLKTAMKSHAEEVKPSETGASEDTQADGKTAKIVTTEEELVAFGIAKSILRNILPQQDITYKDTETYFNVLCRNNVRKWICRFKLDGTRKYLIFPTEICEAGKILIENTDSIYDFSELIIKSAERFKQSSLG